MTARSAVMLALAASLWSTASSAAVFTYTDEAQYLAKLSSLGQGQWSETFEGGVWDGLRTTRDVGGHPSYHSAAAATSQGIVWQGPSYRSPITTEQRYRALPGETTYPASAWSLTAVTRRNGDPDAFAGATAGTLYGVGGWFDAVSGYKLSDTNTEIPKGHMFVSLDGGLNYNDFGAGGDTDPDKLINGIGYFNSTSDHVPRFFGIVDTAGFHSFIFASDQGYPPVEAGSFPGESSEPGFYAPIVYADNFTFAGQQAAPIPEPSIWAAMAAGLLLLGLRLGRRAALAS